MTTSCENIGDLYIEITNKFSDSIDNLFDLLTNKYNPYIFDFDKGDICYVISTCNNIITCRVARRLNKDNKGKFSYDVYPIPEVYKVDILSRIKLYLSKKYGMNFRYPYPWGNVPNKLIAGFNMFETSIEAVHFLELYKIFDDLNTAMKLSFHIQQKRNPDELSQYENLIKLIEKYIEESYESE